MRRDSREGNSAVALFNLLEEIVIRRTRPFIRHAYPEATIQGKKIHFPERKLKTIQYDLESTYSGIYDAVVSGIESLRLAPYNLESYKKEGKVLENILNSYHEKKSLEAAPRTVDPIQQIVATTIQGYINHPGVDRKQAIEIIRFLNQPMLHVQTKELRQIYNDFKNNESIKELIGSISMIKEKYGVEYENKKSGLDQPILLTRSNLKLICFDVVS